MVDVRHEIVAKTDAGMRVDRWFREHVPDLPFGRLQKLLRTGQIRVDGHRVKAADRLEMGQDVRIPPYVPTAANEKPARPAHKVADADKSMLADAVLYKDKSVLAINKPAGLAVQGGKGAARNLDAMLDVLREKGGERPRLVHRLDRDTSGVLLLARTRQAAEDLTAAFRHRDTEKIYWAITVGVPELEEGEINLPLAKSGPRGNEKMRVDTDGKTAVTRYRILDRAGKRAALLELYPVTGRTHQLRAHLAAIGCPILGDGKYGGKGAFIGGEFPQQLHLHARSIALRGSNDLDFLVEAPLPTHLEKSLTLLGLHDR